MHACCNSTFTTFDVVKSCIHTCESHENGCFILHGHFSKVSPSLSTFHPPPPPSPVRSRTVTQRTCSIGRYSGLLTTPLQAPQVSFCDPVWSRMSRQLSQLPNPDLPAGASPQFGGCTQPAGTLTGGHLNSMTGLKSLLQHPMKGDQRLKVQCDAKGGKP